MIINGGLLIFADFFVHLNHEEKYNEIQNAHWLLSAMFETTNSRIRGSIYFIETTNSKTQESMYFIETTNSKTQGSMYFIETTNSRTQGSMNIVKKIKHRIKKKTKYNFHIDCCL
jgi:virulence-associated protein VapD